MEMENEEEMYCMEYNGVAENSHFMSFNNSNRPLLNQEVEVAEEIHPQECQPQEIQQPLYKLNNIDTTASIKTEIKQLIFTKVSEEISSSILNVNVYDAEEEISALKTKTDDFENKTQEFDKEIETDENRLAQIEVWLQDTDEMIGLLKEKIEKITSRYREVHVNELSEQSLQQLQKLQSLKDNTSKLGKEKENLKNSETISTQCNTTLKTELNKKEDILKNLQKNQEKLENMSLSDEIEKCLAKKQVLELKLATLTEKSVMLDNESQGRNNTFNSLSLNKSNREDKFTEFNKQKMKIEQQLTELSHELDEAKTAVADNANQCLQKETELKQVVNQMEVIQETCKLSLEKLRREYDETCLQLNERSMNITNCNINNDQLLMEINALHLKCLQKCEEKFALTNKNLEMQYTMHEIKIDSLKKQMKNETERAKVEELQNHYKKSLALLNSSENDFVNERERNSKEMMELTLKLETAQAEYNEYLEMEKKKEYLFANSKFLEEKLESRQNEVQEIAKSVKNIQEENMSLKQLIERKLNQLEETKRARNILKRPQNETFLKSLLKSPDKQNIPKKVKFSELLFFKSPSSSDISMLPPSGAAEELETSVHQWLQGTGNQVTESEKIEEEF